MGSVLDPTIPIDIGERSQRHRIVEAMIDCCAEKSYAATTIADIVRQASISRTTFYKRFSGKRECFDAALEWCLGEVRAAIAASYSDTDPPPLTVRKAAAATLGLMARNPALSQALLGEAIAVEPGAVARHRTILIEALEGLWTDGGEPRQKRTDPRLALGSAHVLIYDQVVSGRADRLPELLPEIVYVVLLPFVGHEEALAQARTAASAADPELSPGQ